MFLFTFLLYHILNHLSRGFFIFFGGISSPKGDCFVVGIIQHFFSELALVHICIPQTYTPCGRVMGQRSYSLSWAPTFRGRLALSFCTLIVSHFKGFVKRFFTFFFEGCFVLHFRFRYSLPVCPLLLTPLLYHNLGDLSRGFSEISEIFSGVGRVHFCGSFPIPTQRSRPTPWTGLLPRPLTMIVYHTPPQKSTWQSVQIRASKLFDFCTTFLLTNCWRYGIMEIPAPTSEGAAPKN